MTVDEAADRLRKLLLDVGFDAVQPNAALAWEAFKRFATEPVDTPTTEVWFEAADGNPGTESDAYFDFVRMFTHHEEDDVVWSEQITAHFTASPTVQLGLRRGSIQANDIANLTGWFKAVEASPGFHAGVAYAGWSFEVRIDGC
jgi:hypothetical protein